MPLVRSCRNRRCPAYATRDDGWCDAHRPASWSSPMPPGWKQIRAAQLAAFPWCQECGLVPATDVDHVIPRSAGGTDDPGNLQSLCGPCHHRRTGRMHGWW